MYRQNESKENILLVFYSQMYSDTSRILNKTIHLHRSFSFADFIIINFDVKKEVECLALIKMIKFLSFATHSIFIN